MQSHLQSRFVCFSFIIRNEAFGFVIESGFSQIWKNWSRQRQRFDLGLFLGIPLVYKAYILQCIWARSSALDGWVVQCPGCVWSQWSISIRAEQPRW